MEQWRCCFGYNGNLVAATSTGGMINKKYRCIGDVYCAPMQATQPVQ